MAPRPPPTHYEILGVAESALIEEIRLAYRTAAREAHPDSGGRGDRMQHLNRAWHVLQDPGRRASYDQELAAGRRPATPQAPPSSAREAPNAQDLVGTPFDADDYDPYDDLVAAYEDEDDDLVFVGFNAGDVPPVEGWWAMLPPAVLVFGLVLGGVGLLFASPALLVFAGGALFVSFGLFVLVPMRSMIRASQTRASQTRTHRLRRED